MRFDASPRHEKIVCHLQGIARCLTVWADLVLVCHTISDDKRTHGPG